MNHFQLVLAISTHTVLIIHSVYTHKNKVYRLLSFDNVYAWGMTPTTKIYSVLIDPLSFSLLLCIIPLPLH